MNDMQPVMETKLKSSQASDQIAKWIRSGRFLPGHRLPSERAMADELGMNHLTVRRGLADLVSRGVVEKRRNVGNFVARSGAVASMAIVLPQFVTQVSSPHPYFSHVVAGLQETLDPRVSSTSILSYRVGQLLEDVKPGLVSAGVRGIVLAPGADVTVAQVQQLLDVGIKVVLVKPSVMLLPLNLLTIEVDTFATLAQLVHGLYGRGHRRIAYAHYMTDPLMPQSLAIVQATTRQAGLDDGSVRRIGIPSDERSIDFSPLNQLFEGSDRPTAVIVHDEFAAAALFRLCYEKHIRVPNDLSVVAVTDSAPFLHPVPLTAGDGAAAGRTLGALAGERLLQLVNGKQAVERQISVRCEIRWQASVAVLGSPVAESLAGI